MTDDDLTRRERWRTPARESEAPSAERCGRCRRVMQHQRRGERDWFVCDRCGTLTTFSEVRKVTTVVNFEQITEQALALFGEIGASA